MLGSCIISTIILPNGLEMIPVFSSTSYDCHKYLMSDVVMTIVTCAGKNQVSFPSLCGGIYLTPFPILKMIYLQNIRIQVKT